MSLSIFARQTSKFRSLQRFGAIQLSTLRQIQPNSNVLNNCKQLIKNEKFLARKISLTAPRFAGAGASHVGLWKVERVFAVALLGLLPAAIAFPSKVLDSALAIILIMHQYWGMDAIIIDYVRAVIVGPVVPKIARGLLVVLSIATLGGIFSFIYNDIGIGNGIRKLWSIKAQ